MANTIDLNKIYDTSYHQQYSFLREILLLELSNSKKTIRANQTVTRDKVSLIERALTSISFDETSSRPDMYVEDLLKAHKSKIKDYVNNDMNEFINDHLHIIKKKHKDYKQALPQNVELSPQDTVMLIAKINACNNFDSRFSDMYGLLDNISSMEEYMNIFDDESFDFEKYNRKQKNTTVETIESIAISREDTTTARQVIIFKYLFAKAQIKNIDNTNLAELIRFLTQKELGNRKIGSTSIYKQLTKDESESDLKYVKDLLQRLNLERSLID